MSGPLGVLPGMTYDPIRNRYFPTPKDGGKVDLDPKGKKRLRFDAEPVVEAVHVPIAGPSRRRIVRPSGRRREMNRDGSLGSHFGKLVMKEVCECCPCSGENVTSIRSFVGGAFFATTDHGKVVVTTADGEGHAVTVCSASVLGVHCDVARLTMMSISAGPRPHAHVFKRAPEALDHMWIEATDLALPEGDVYCMSSFDDRCTVGGSHSLNIVHYASRLATTYRKLPSDPLCVHQSSSDIAFVGMRSSQIRLDDLRVKGRRDDTIAQLPGSKAVVGVKRLKDSAVPWGLLASGMSDQLMIFDIRFAKQPLRCLKGHVNSFHSDLGLATTPTDSHVLAAGSDDVVRAWSTQTGEPMSAAEGSSGEDHLLGMTFPSRVRCIQVREDDMGVDVAYGGTFVRFGREL
ncbi:hypothetical protein P7C73_g4980, partial [Tremellales sp. Uapishka_1]